MRPTLVEQVKPLDVSAEAGRRSGKEGVWREGSDLFCLPDQQGQLPQAPDPQDFSLRLRPHGWQESEKNSQHPLTQNMRTNHLGGSRPFKYASFPRPKLNLSSSEVRTRTNRFSSWSFGGDEARAGSGCQISMRDLADGIAGREWIKGKKGEVAKKQSGPAALLPASNIVSLLTVS